MGYCDILNFWAVTLFCPQACVTVRVKIKLLGRLLTSNPLDRKD